MSHSGGNKAKAISVKGNLVWKESNSIVCHVVMMIILFLCQNPDDHPQPGCDHNDISAQERSRLPREPPSLSQGRRTERRRYSTQP